MWAQPGGPTLADMRVNKRIVNAFQTFVLSATCSRYVAYCAVRSLCATEPHLGSYLEVVIIHEP